MESGDKPVLEDESVGTAGPIFSKTTFADLEGWATDDLGSALRTFEQTCASILDANPDRALDRKTGPDSLYGTVADWQPVCARAMQSEASTDPRRFFESHFVPFHVATIDDASASARSAGLITGYYEPEVRGSLTRGGIYQTPLLSKPADLLRVDLQDFDPTLGNESIRGRIQNGRFVPYPDRAAINRGALDANSLAVAWIADPVDAFFIHIQGSARLLLPNGEAVRVGFAGKNGRPYTAIGKVLVARGALNQGDVTMQSIRNWLNANPSEVETVLEANQSYVFFNAVPIRDTSLGPTGAAGVALTPGRSLAVDRRHHALGAPIWLEANMPGNTGQMRRLMIAQDTGSAIRGIVRGDYFWGSGEEAAARAGETKADGRFWTLIPTQRAENWATKP